jgi:hypothetical protein
MMMRWRERALFNCTALEARGFSLARAELKLRAD